VAQVQEPEPGLTDQSSLSDRVIGRCRLCGNVDVWLQNSHIIPQLVFRHMKRRDKNKTFRVGDMRDTGIPLKPLSARRVQDGQRWPLLCSGCEERLAIMKMSSEGCGPFAKTSLRNSSALCALRGEPVPVVLVAPSRS
jgi:hypothetical protein